MSTILENYKAFIACPSGLDEEREYFKTLLREFSEADANARNVNFTPIGWEYTLGGVGRPQSLINEEIKDCDYFILVLHDRWGTPTNKPGSAKYTSGSEEEYNLALELYKDSEAPMKELVLFFKAVSDRQLSDPGEELQKVLNFRKERERDKDLFFHTYDTPDKFKSLLQKHLYKWTRDHESKNSHSFSELIYEYGDKLTIDELRHQEYLEESDLLEHAEWLASEGKLVEAEVEFSKIIVMADFPWAVARYGRFLRKIGQPHRAKAILESAVALADNLDDPYTKAYATRQIARLMEDEGDTNSSAILFKDAIDYYKMLDDKDGLARTYRDLGQTLRKKGLLKESVTELEKALNIYTSTNNLEGEAAILGYLGIAYRSLGELKKSEHFHRKSLKIHTENNNEEAIAIVNGNLGVIMRQQGKLDEAKELHIKALNHHEKIHKTQGIVRELSNLGTVYRHQGDLENSRKSHKKSLRLSEEMGNKHSIAIQFSCLGQIDILEHKLEDAEKKHIKSLEISQAIGNMQSCAIQYKNLGTIYRLRNEFNKSMKAVREALKIDQKYGFRYGISQCYIELGKLHFIENNEKKSLSFLEKSKNLLDEIGADREREIVINAISAVKSKNNKFINQFLKMSHEQVKIT